MRRAVGGSPAAYLEADGHVDPAAERGAHGPRGQAQVPEQLGERLRERDPGSLLRHHHAGAHARQVHALCLREEQPWDQATGRCARSGQSERTPPPRSLRLLHAHACPLPSALKDPAVSSEPGSDPPDLRPALLSCQMNEAVPQGGGSGGELTPGRPWAPGEGSCSTHCSARPWGP